MRARSALRNEWNEQGVLEPDAIHAFLGGHEGRTVIIIITILTISQ